MQDLQARLERLLADAAECEIISNLTTPRLRGLHRNIRLWRKRSAWKSIHEKGLSRIRQPAVVKQRRVSGDGAAPKNRNQTG